MFSAAHWLTTTAGLSAQTRTCRVGIWIVLASATTHFSNQKPSNYILGSQWWSIIEWWISIACYSKQASGMLNILSRVTRCGSSGEDGVSNILEYVSKVGRQGEYNVGLEGLSWSGGIILAAIQLGNNLLWIIQVHWFVNCTLKLITNTSNSMLCSHIWLVCPFPSPCTQRWRRLAGI